MITRNSLIAWGAAALLLACGSAATSGGNGSSAGSAGSGAQSSGGSPSADAGHAGVGLGGAHAIGGSGGSSAGNANAAAGNGAGGFQGCHQASECTNTRPPPLPFAIVMCLNPGESAPGPGCGAPQWCGQCNCPPQPTPPLGNGMACQSNADCPQPNATAPTASVCNSGTCTACTQNSDCPSSTPTCGTVTAQFIDSFRACSVCTADTDCPSARPHCQGSYGVSACVECRTTADCASGVCSNGSCTPQCTASQACGAGMQCNAQQRCEALSCQSDADCLANQACTMGHCGRRACTTDPMCQGACVNGGCYDSLGTCYVYLQAA